jgi:hypothetical protein
MNVVSKNWDSPHERLGCDIYDCLVEGILRETSKARRALAAKATNVFGGIKLV